MAHNAEVNAGAGPSKGPKALAFTGYYAPFLFINQGVQLKKTSDERKSGRDFLSCRELDVRAFFEMI
jgi:hypothetical protein